MTGSCLSVSAALLVIVSCLGVCDRAERAEGCSTELSLHTLSNMTSRLHCDWRPPRRPFGPIRNEWGSTSGGPSCVFRLLRSRQEGLTIYTARTVHTVGTVARHCGHLERGAFELLSQQVKAIIIHKLHCKRNPPSSSNLWEKSVTCLL